MEKAHGWQYVRSKNNGKNREKGSTGLPTPQMTNMQTPSSEGNTVDTPDEDMFTDLSTGYDSSAIYNADALNFPEYTTHSEIDMFGSNHAQLQLDYSPISEMDQSASAGHSPYLDTNMGQDHFQENFQDFATNGTGDFNLYDNEDLYSANVQLPTPSHEIFQRLDTSAYTTSGVPYDADPVPHISPVGQGNTMLYTPNSLQEVDEFEDFFPSNSMGNTADFQLYPSSTGGTITSSAPSALFGEIPPQNININFPGTTAKELLDFYAAATTAATQGNHHHINNGAMDWATDEGFSNF